MSAKGVQQNNISSACCENCCKSVFCETREIPFSFVELKVGDWERAAVSLFQRCAAVSYFIFGAVDVTETR